MKGVEYYVHRRKRREKNTEPFPSSKILIRWLDRIAIGAGILGPVMTAPQIYKIYYFQSAMGVSALSWIAFGLLDIPFILYGFVHKDRLILITYILWCTVNLTVALGAVLYS